MTWSQDIQSVLDCFPVETFHRVVSAKIALIDFAALSVGTLNSDLKDLNTSCKIADSLSNNDTVAQWILDEAALISIPHLCDNEVNAKVVIDMAPVQAHRPPRYGRACSRLVPTPILSSTKNRDDPSVENESSRIWFDLKGTGIGALSQPFPRPYTTGLLSLSDALSEYAWSNLINAVFDNARAPFRCVPIYAVIDLGFDFNDGSGELQRAAVCVRRGHLRNLWSDLPAVGSQDHTSCLTVELLLRRYGITSVGDQSVYFHVGPTAIALTGAPGVTKEKYVPIADVGSTPNKTDISGIIDCVNIQFAYSAVNRVTEVVDLGHFSWRKRFTRPLMSTVSNRHGACGGILWPHEPQYPQPLDSLIVPDDDWGWVTAEDGQYIRIPNSTCQQLALDFVRQRISENDVKVRLDRIVNRACAKWQ